jgi:hypothetical protein
MVTQPPFGIASRALISTLSTAISRCTGSTSAEGTRGRRLSWTSIWGPTEFSSISPNSTIRLLRFVGFASSRVLRAKARSCFVSLEPRSAARLAFSRGRRKDSSSVRESASSRLPETT